MSYRYRFSVAPVFGPPAPPPQAPRFRDPSSCARIESASLSDLILIYQPTTESRHDCEGLRRYAVRLSLLKPVDEAVVGPSRSCQRQASDSCRRKPIESRRQCTAISASEVRVDVQRSTEAAAIQSMDPITALALACNVMQLVEQATDAARVCKEIYEQGSLGEYNRIDEYAQDIAAANKDLEATLSAPKTGTASRRPTQLQKFVADSFATTAGLKKGLNQLKPSTSQEHKQTGSAPGRTNDLSVSSVSGFSDRPRMFC